MRWWLATLAVSGTPSYTRFTGTHKTNLGYDGVFREPMLPALILVSTRRPPPALAGDGNGSQSAATPALGIIVERKHIRISPFDPRRGAPVRFASQTAREFRLPCAACVRPQNEDPCGCGSCVNQLIKLVHVVAPRGITQGLGLAVIALKGCAQARPERPITPSTPIRMKPCDLDINTFSPSLVRIPLRNPTLDSAASL